MTSAPTCAAPRDFKDPFVSIHMFVRSQAEELLACSLSGDEATYRQFLERLSSHRRGYLRRRLRSLPDEVENLLQELLFAIHNQHVGIRLEGWNPSGPEVAGAKPSEYRVKTVAVAVPRHALRSPVQRSADLGRRVAWPRLKRPLIPKPPPGCKLRRRFRAWLWPWLPRDRFARSALPCRR
jgi:hypothetical protein